MAELIVSAGFKAETVGTSKRWMRLACEKCPKRTLFVNCTPDRAAWLAKVHRHGSAHTPWHSDEPTPAERHHGGEALNRVMDALCVASQAVLHTPRDVFCDPAIYAAGEALVAQLETVLAINLSPRP